MHLSPELSSESSQGIPLSGIQQGTINLFSSKDERKKNIIHHLNELMDIEKQHSSSSEAR
jgi:hypothetical protein